MRWWGGVLALVVWLAPGWAGYPSASWEGLTGLYTLPTAEMLPAHAGSLTFSEIRFAQSNGARRIRNLWYTGSAAYAPSARLEVAATIRHDILDVEPYGGIPTSDGEQKVLLHAKYQLVPLRDGRVGVALGVQDLGDRTAEFRNEPSRRGRRLFLVGTYRWATVGFTDDDQGAGFSAGARWRISNHVDLVGEYNTRPVFIKANPAPANHANYNMGFRIYPPEVPDLRIDLTAVGDGRFDFGFSFSYLFK